MDPIANMLTSVRNAHTAGLSTVVVPGSKLKLAILAILKREGYIENMEQSGDVKPVITIALRYNNRLPAISHVRRVSTPGLRVYRKRNELPRPLRGMGIAILSTPQGVLTDREARKQGLGGEVLCEVW